MEGQPSAHTLDAKARVVTDVVKAPFALPVSPRPRTRLLGAVRRPSPRRRERGRLGSGADGEMAETEAEIRQEGARTLEVLLPPL